MSNYKDTLNLPKTAFSMKAKLTQKEPAKIEDWQNKDIYQVIRELCKGRPKFILHDGPPYANGDIHIGHAVNKILKDFIIKYKTLSGFDAPLVPGWDCHGLPIENKVEQLLGTTAKKSDSKLFRAKCCEYAQTQIEKQKQDFKRLGILADWDNPYLTMNFNTEANIIRALGKIIKNGHLMRGYKPIYWNVVGESALSEAEVEYQDKTSYQVDVAYELDDCKSVIKKLNRAFDQEIDNLFIVIWTTTPWTLPSSQAVAVSPDTDYAVVSCKFAHGAKNLIIAKDLFPQVLKRYKVTDHLLIGTIKGTELENLTVNHPFYDKKLPIILGHHVTTDSGTGCVHTAPDHGVDDFNVGKRYQLYPVHLIDSKGIYKKDVEFFAGEHIYKVDAKVIAKLEECDRLLAQDKFTHSYPHCWRTKVPLIYRATPQWFISMTQKDLLKQSLDSLAQVDFTPSWGENRLTSTLKQSPDWCISRQRVWGVPITLFVHKETEELHPDTEVIIEKVAELVEQSGIDAWYDLSIKSILPEQDINNYVKVTDTLDVWFDSGVTHATVVDTNKTLQSPADLYLEGSDQHRGWFQSSLKTSIAIKNCAPYKQLLTHGFVVDANGKKMSKSLGNVISPQKIVDTMGADILRLWVASVDYTKEIAVSQDSFVKIADIYRRIRNTARFLLSNLDSFLPEEHLVASKNMIAIDQWITSKSEEIQQEIIYSYDKYNFAAIFKKIHDFCSIYLGGFYLDIIKDRQYTTGTNSLARRSCQSAMYHILEGLTRWLAPIISFTADEIWNAIPGDREDTVFFTSWYKFPLISSKLLTNDFWKTIIDIKSKVNKAIEACREQNIIGSSLEADITLYVSTNLFHMLSTLGDELRFILITSTATIDTLESAPDNAIATADKNLKLQIIKSTAKKCERCWHRTDDIGSDEEHKNICLRCVGNITNKEEERRFA